MGPWPLIPAPRRQSPHPGQTPRVSLPLSASALFSRGDPSPFSPRALERRRRRGASASPGGSAAAPGAAEQQNPELLRARPSCPSSARVAQPRDRGHAAGGAGRCPGDAPGDTREIPGRCPGRCPGFSLRHAGLEAADSRVFPPRWAVWKRRCPTIPKIYTDPTEFRGHSAEPFCF